MLSLISNVMKTKDVKICLGTKPAHLGYNQIATPNEGEPELYKASQKRKRAILYIPNI